MTDDEIIAALTRKIAKIEEARSDAEEALKKIRRTMYCIGGPLNDNNLQYNKQQLITFAEISMIIDSVL